MSWMWTIQLLNSECSCWLPPGDTETCSCSSSAFILKWHKLNHSRRKFVFRQLHELNRPFSQTPSSPSPSGSLWHDETEPAELLPEDRLAAGEAATPAGEIWLLEHHRSDSQRSDRPAAGTQTQTHTAHVWFIFIQFLCGQTAQLSCFSLRVGGGISSESLYQPAFLTHWWL